MDDDNKKLTPEQEQAVIDHVALNHLGYNQIRGRIENNYDLKALDPKLDGLQLTISKLQEIVDQAEKDGTIKKIGPKQHPIWEMMEKDGYILDSKCRYYEYITPPPLCHNCGTRRRREEGKEEDKMCDRCNEYANRYFYEEIGFNQLQFRCISHEIAKWLDDFHRRATIDEILKHILNYVNVTYGDGPYFNKLFIRSSLNGKINKDVIQYILTAQDKQGGGGKFKVMTFNEPLYSWNDIQEHEHTGEETSSSSDSEEEEEEEKELIKKQKI